MMPWASSSEGSCPKYFRSFTSFFIILMTYKSLCLGLLLTLNFGLSTKGQTTRQLPQTPAVSDKNNRADYATQLLYATASGDTLWQQMGKIDGLKEALKDVVSKDKIPLMGEFNKLDKWTRRVKDLKKIYNSTVINTSYYATNTVDTTEGSYLTSDFMNLNAAVNLNVMGLPFSIQSSVVLQNGAVKTDFSYTNVRFDLDKYKEDWRSKLSVQQLQKAFNFDGITEGVKLNRLDSSVLSKEMGFTLYNGLMNNPKVIKMRERVSAELDSIKQATVNHLLSKGDSFRMDSTVRRFLPKGDSLHLDSIKTSMLKDTAFWRSKLNDSTQRRVDSLLAKQAIFVKMYHKYDSLWEKRKGYIQQFEALKTKLSTVEAALKKLDNFDSLKTVLLKSGTLKLKDKLMLKVKGLETGQFGADEQEFVLKNQLLNGLKFDYEDKQRTWGIVIGRSRLEALNAPIFYNPFQRLTSGRDVIMLKMRQILRGSSALTMRLMNVHKTQDTLFQGNLTPNYNTVLGLSYDKMLSKTLFFQIDAAVSNVRQTMMIAEEDVVLRQSQNQNWAASASLNWQRFKAFGLSLGYYYVGNGFYTFGNDFLINNRNGIKATLKSSLFKDKIKLDIDVKRGVLNAPSSLGLAQSALLQMNGSATWQFAKNQMLQCQYMPNTLTERQVRSDGRGFDYQSNIYLLMGNFSYNIAKKKQTTLLMLSNLNQQIDFFDSLRVTKTNYISFRHETFLSKKSSLIFKLNEGLSDRGVVQTGQIQTEAKFWASSKCQLTLGLQMVKKRVEPDWRKGVVAQMNLKLSDKLIARWGMIYRGKNTEGGIPSDEWISNAAMTIQF